MLKMLWWQRAGVDAAACVAMLISRSASASRESSRPPRVQSFASARSPVDVFGNGGGPPRPNLNVARKGFGKQTRRGRGGSERSECACCVHMPTTSPLTASRVSEMRRDDPGSSDGMPGVAVAPPPASSPPSGWGTGDEGGVSNTSEGDRRSARDEDGAAAPPAVGFCSPTAPCPAGARLVGVASAADWLLSCA